MLDSTREYSQERMTMFPVFDFFALWYNFVVVFFLMRVPNILLFSISLNIWNKIVFA